MDERFKQAYEHLLFRYLEERGEEQLFAAQQLSKRSIQDTVRLSEVISTHFEAMSKKVELPPIWQDSYRFFLEFTMHYSLSLGEREAWLANQQQLEAELSLAASVQQSLLPDISQAELPDDVELGVVSVAPRKVSGDFYSFNANQDAVEIALADISGKSIPAAILMAMMRFAMDEVLGDKQIPHRLLASLNRFVCKNTESSTFVTMFCGTYKQENSMFYYANAGHEPALLYRAAQDEFTELTTDGCALGISRSFRFETRSVQLAPGDMVLLYTDGVIESRDSDRIDDSSMLQTLLRQIDPQQSATQIVSQLHQRILSLSERQIHDDQTLLLFRKKPS
ncbi:SpoIIE family protein phosphatase [Brevibacillus dissolubilis]|uniref:SpoIIE family protein phosphatase n=1 Tax=Brevibacillus dissolubilis TaxID=1844116 RepID=UPI00111623DA|nr:SpoIIE family protein phosphatase [Brevibacillus dissolubilis]